MLQRGLRIGGNDMASYAQTNIIKRSFGIFSALLVVAFAWLTWQDYDATVTAAVESNAGLAVALEEHTERSLEAVELTLETIARDFTSVDLATWVPDRREWEQYRGMARRLPQVSSYAVFDRNGKNRLVTTAFPSPAVSAADRAYFVALRSGARTYISDPIISRFNGKPIFAYGVRLEDMHGNFNGVLIASLEIGYFRHFYRSLDLGSSGSVAIIRSDGQTLMREPTSVASRFPDLSKDVLFTDLLPQAPAGSFRSMSPYDQQERFAAYRASKTRPFVVVAARSTADVLAPFWLHTSILATGTIIAIALLAALSRFLVRRSESEAEHARALVASRDFGDAILDSVTSHIVILDRDGVITRTNIAWRRFAMENGYAGDPSFAGQNYLAAVRDDASAGRAHPVAEGIRSVMTGDKAYYEAEYPCHSPATQRWFCMRVSPLGCEPGSVVVVHEDVTRIKRMEEKFRLLATHDELTGLSNRRQFCSVLEHAVHGSARAGKPGIALLFIDLDGFKEVNDTLGHEAGDHLLKEFAARLLGVVRKTDTVARLGGDEFVILLEHLADAASDVPAIADKILDMACAPFAYRDNICRVSASVGIGLFDHQCTADQLLSRADDAMYVAKQSGKNRWAIYHLQPPPAATAPAGWQLPARPDDEAGRLATLHALGLLDGPSEPMLDRITRLAATMLKVPTALVSLVDAERQWFLSRQGLEATGTPRNVSFCAHAILEDAAMIVPDALQDARFAGNPIVAGEPHIRFYAGMPISVGGARIGTLCLIDYVPRAFSRREVEVLAALAKTVEGIIELRSGRAGPPATAALRAA